MSRAASPSLPDPIVAKRNGIETRVPLPVRNTVQGGAHAVIKARVGRRTLEYKMSDLAIQEHHIIPMTYDMAKNQVMANTIQDVVMNMIFGRVGMMVRGLGGSAMICWMTISMLLVAKNSLLPVTISKKITPSE